MTHGGCRPVSMVSGCVLAALLAAGCGSETSAPEVVLYTSVDRQVAEPIVAEFRRQSGLRLRVRYDTEATKTLGLVQRLRAEAERPAADVFWSSEIFHTVRLADEGLLAPYESAAAADWPAAWRDPEGRWYGFGVRVRVVAYNTARVPESEAPRRIEDLLEAKWKGRIAMADPAFGTTAGHVAAWFVHYGPDRARQILEGLKANEVRLLAANSTAVKAVATGEVDVCLTDTDDVYAAQANGWPVALHILGHGEAGALGIPNTAAVVAGGPNPVEAKAFMAFLLSERVERLLAESVSRNTPVRADLADEFPACERPKWMVIDYAEVAAALPEAVRTAGEVLR